MLYFFGKNVCAYSDLELALFKNVCAYSDLELALFKNLVDNYQVIVPWKIFFAFAQLFFSTKIATYIYMVCYFNLCEFLLSHP